MRDAMLFYVNEMDVTATWKRR